MRLHDNDDAFIVFVQIRYDRESFNFKYISHDE